MPKICLISDSHGNKEKIDDLLFNNSFDYIFFMGDGLRDFSNYYLDNLKMVSGNCDLFSDEPLTTFVTIRDKKIMITHGHSYKAKLTKLFMANYAKEQCCDIVCYGHTHYQKDEIINGVRLINPGSLKNGEYAVLEIENNLSLEISIFSIISSKAIIATFPSLC